MSSSLKRRSVRSAAELALLPPAAFAVHQLRYLLAYGGGTTLELERTGHNYLHSAVPWIVMLLALVAGQFLRALGRAAARQTSLPRYTLSLTGMWLVCTTVLVAVFATQEFLEGMFITGHPAGLVGIFGYGGWWAVPAAACVGLVLAAWFHGARWVVRQVARRFASAFPRPRRARLSFSFPAAATPTSAAPLARGWSQRGPPA